MTAFSISPIDGSAIAIGRSPFVIGREVDCDMVVDDARVSRRHAQLEVLNDGGVVLRDLGSSNGTFVDDNRIVGGVWFAVPGSFRVGRTVLNVDRVDPEVTLPLPIDTDATLVVGREEPPPLPLLANAETPVQLEQAVLAAPPIDFAPQALAASPRDAVRLPGFRSAHRRAMVAMAALGLTAVLNLMSAAHLAGFGALAADLVSGVANAAEADAFDAQTTLIGAAYLIVFVAAGIAYVAWLSRSVENAPAVGAGTPARSPRAAIGWWFVPVASFVVPYQIVADLHDRLAIGRDLGRARQILFGWWLAWVVGNLSVYGRVLAGNETLEQLQTGASTTILGDVVLVISAILGILVVRRIQRREDARAASIGNDLDPRMITWRS